MWFEESQFAGIIRNWWKDIIVEGWAGFKLASKLIKLKKKIKERVKNHFGEVKTAKANI